MGSLLCCEGMVDSLVGSPESNATAVFLQHWEQFLAQKKDFRGGGRVDPPWSHKRADKWAKKIQEEVIIKQLNKLGLSSRYKYSVDGSKESGAVTFILKMKPAKQKESIEFHLTISYDNNPYLDIKSPGSRKASEKVKGKR